MEHYYKPVIGSSDDVKFANDIEQAWKNAWKHLQLTPDDNDECGCKGGSRTILQTAMKYIESYLDIPLQYIPLKHNDNSSSSINDTKENKR